MSNFFDQFDAAPAPPPASAPLVKGGNFFDQFDAPTDSGNTGDSIRAMTPAEEAQFAMPATPAPQPKTGIAANAAAGTNEAVTGILGAPVDAANWMLGKIGLPTSATPVMGSQWLKNLEASYGGSPDQIAPANEIERLARGAGAGVAGSVLPAGAVSAAEKLGMVAGPTLDALKTAVGMPAPQLATAGGIAGAGGVAASDLVPEPYKPLANVVGATVAPLITHMALPSAGGTTLSALKLPSAPANVVDVGGAAIPISSGQLTGDVTQSQLEQMALRGAKGPQAQRVAQQFADAQKAALANANEGVIRGLDSAGSIVAADPQQAAEMIGRSIAQSQASKGAAEAQSGTNLSLQRSKIGASLDPVNGDVGIHPLDAADQILDALTGSAQRNAETLAQQQAAREAQITAQRAQTEAQRSGISQGLSPGSNAGPQDAATTISQSVQGAAQNAREARTAAYGALREVPGEFAPGAFRRVGNSVIQRLDRGQEPLIVNDKTMPSTSAALRDLQNHFSGVANAASDTGNPRPITMATVDDARKRLIAFQRQANSAGRASGDMSDAYGMRRLIAAFDDHVQSALTPGAFSGNPEEANQTMRVARNLHSQYRSTFTPQGAGDQVGRAMQDIIGRFQGQEATPTKVVQTMYGPSGNPGGGSLAPLVARRLHDIFGDGSPEWNAYRQGLFAHVTETPEGQAPFTPAVAANRIFKFLNGDGQSLAQIAFSPAERDAIAQYGASLQRPEPAPVEAPRVAPTDAVSKAIMQAAGLQGQRATSTQIADLMFGRTAIGENPTGVKLAAYLKQNSPEAFQALRQGLFSKLTGVADGAIGFDPAKSAASIRRFLTGPGRPMADVAFTPEEQASLGDYASQLDRHAIISTEPKDEVSRIINRISTRDGEITATPTEISNWLFGSSGTGASSTSVKVAQRLRSIVGPQSPEWSAIRQGMWMKLTQAPEGMTAWGPQKVSERIFGFLNGAGRPLAHVLFSEDERDLMSRYAGTLKMTVPPPGATNPSGTAAWMSKLGGTAKHLLPLLGLHAGGVPGALAGFAADAALPAIGNRIAAARVARSLYRAPPISLRAPTVASSIPMALAPPIDQRTSRFSAP